MRFQPPGPRGEKRGGQRHDTVHSLIRGGIAQGVERHVAAVAVTDDNVPGIRKLVAAVADEPRETVAAVSTRRMGVRTGPGELPEHDVAKTARQLSPQKRPGRRPPVWVRP